MENNVYILSDAPKVRLDQVLEYVGVKPYLQGAISGESGITKANGKVFKTLDTTNARMIGDQVQSDILNPKKFGLTTVYINYDGEICDDADRNIKSLQDLHLIL